MKSIVSLKINKSYGTENERGTKTMEKEDIELITKIISGMPRYKWDRLKEVIDREYKNRAEKVVLSDSALLKNAIAAEFNP